MKWFGKNIDPKCEYCALGQLSFDQEKVLCSKRGVVDPWYRCRRFSYDPLKRQPAAAPAIPIYSKEDFEI